MAIDTSWKPVTVPDLGGSSFLTLSGTLNKNAIEALNNITSQAQKQLELQQQQREFEVKQGLEQLKYELEQKRLEQAIDKDAWDREFNTKQKEKEWEYKDKYLATLLGNRKATEAAAANVNNLSKDLIQMAKSFAVKPRQRREITGDEYAFITDVLDEKRKAGEITKEDEIVLLKYLPYTDSSLYDKYKAVKEKDTYYNRYFDKEQLNIPMAVYNEGIMSSMEEAKQWAQYDRDYNTQGMFLGTLPLLQMKQEDSQLPQTTETSETKGPFGN